MVNVYEEKIKAFELAFRKLQISMITKVHILCHDVPRFIKKTGLPLGVFHEQTFEACHDDFGHTFDNFEVSDTKNPNFGPQLRQAVVHYNSNHL